MDLHAFTRLARRMACATALVVLSAAARADAPPSAPALALREHAAALALKLENNAFGQPLSIESSESAERASGEVYAVLPHPFALLDTALARSEQWCEVLVLHLNVKQCSAEASRVTLMLGGKREQASEQAMLLALAYSVPIDTPDYLQVRLQARRGPLGTRDYGFDLEATSLPEGRSFVHFRYTVGYGWLARLLMQGYFGSLGRDKIGFSTLEGASGEPPMPVAGTRGAVERNAMRYYLAIAVYLDSLVLPPEQRVQARLVAWFDATERYARQLHEMDRDEYLAMKRQALGLAP